MAEVTKYELITNNNNIIADIKTHFSKFKIRKGTSFVYGIVLIFVFFTIFLAFSPSTSSSSSSPWFVNIFNANSTYSPPRITSSTNDSNTRSDTGNFSSVHSYFLPNSTQSYNFSQIINSTSQNNQTIQVPVSQNLNYSLPISPKLNNTEISDGKVRSFEQNNSTGDPSSNPVSVDSAAVAPTTPKTNVSSDTHGLGSKPVTVKSAPSIVVPITAKTSEISSNTTIKGRGVEASSSDHEDENVKEKGNSEVEKLVGCDLYNGNWVKDESYPLYKPGSCSFIDEQFNCLLNGRPDRDFQKLKWIPNGCSIPRLNAGHMLELLRGKRLVFVGDSLNRNMWESLVCILENSVRDKKNVYEAFGRHHFRTEASYSFVFKDYNCTVEFFVSPFLVQQWEVTDEKGKTQETLRLDLMVSDADQFKSADFIVFNTGHWWTHDKTSKGEDYYQEGSHVYKQLDVTEAFRRAITTWARWVDANVDPQRTHVLLRGYSASHFSGGQWNSGGQCDSETDPIRNETYLTEYPWKMQVFEKIIKNMKTHVSFLNITRSTDYRKDGHPSIYRKQHLSGDEKKSPLRYQDCSHWCLPGVPDSWNELLYGELLRKQFLDQQKKKT